MSRLVVWTLALLPLVYLVSLLWQYHIDVPYGDQWELVLLLDKLDRRTLSLADLWAQHNEHRPLFPVAIMLGLALATGWNTGAELVANVVVGIGIFLVLWRGVRTYRPEQDRAPIWLLPMLSLLIFSPNQWENWLWGWQLSILLNVLAAVGGLYWLAAPGSGRLRFTGALVLGVVATYSFAIGLSYWVVGSLAIWVTPRHRTPRRVGLWLLVAITTVASYFYHYQPNPGHPSILGNFASFERFGVYLLYVVKYLGAAMASYDQTMAAVVGVVGLTLYAWLAVRRRALWRSPIVAVAILVGLYALTSAFMTGLGRAGFGSWQATGSRYITVSTPFWVSILMLLALPARPGGPAEGAGWKAWGRAGVVAALCLSSLLSARAGTLAARARYEHLRPARRALFTGRDDGLLARLYLDSAAVKARRDILVRLHLSIFRND